MLLGDAAAAACLVDLELEMAAAAAAAAALRVVCRVVWTGAGITGCFPDMPALEDDACIKSSITVVKSQRWIDFSKKGTDDLEIGIMTPYSYSIVLFCPLGPHSLKKSSKHVI